MHRTLVVSPSLRSSGSKWPCHPERSEGSQMFIVSTSGTLITMFALFNMVPTHLLEILRYAQDDRRGRVLNNRIKEPAASSSTTSTILCVTSAFSASLRCNTLFDINVNRVDFHAFRLVCLMCMSELVVL